MPSSATAAATRACRGFGFLCYVTALSCGCQTDRSAASAPESGGAASGNGGATISVGSGGGAGSSASVGPNLFTGTGGILVVGAARDDLETGGTGPVDAGPPPVVPCGTGVDASGDAPGEPPCEPPPSHCVDENTLAFYTDGQCVDGTCKWTTQVLTCAMGCFGLGCRRNVTLPN